MGQTIDVSYNLDLDDFFKKSEAVSNRLGAIEAAIGGMKRQNPFVAANQSAIQFNNTLGQQVTIYQKIEATAESFRQEQIRLKQVYTELKAKQNEFIAAGRYQELTAQLDLVKGRLAELKKGFPELADEVEKVGKPGKGGSSGGGIKGLVAELGTAITVSFGVAEAMKLMVTESAKFGKGLSELSALTGVTGKDLAFLADAATNLEAKTGIAASDIVEGFKLVGSIKPELLASKEALASVTDEVIALAQASGIPLQDAATAAVGALNQFEEGADQAGRFVNVLAAGAKLGASEVKDTAEALKTSGTAMKAAGLSFEQGNAVLQSLAGVMIKGSEAGTGLRNVLLKLETDSDKNLRPSIVGLDKALENAAKKYDTTTELTKVFGVENIVAARRILDTREEISKLTKELTGTNVAYEQQKVNLDNLSTDLDRAGVAFKGFFRDLGQSQDGFLRFAIQSFTSFLTSLSSKTGEYKAFLKGFFDDGFIAAIANPISALRNGLNAGRNQSSVNALANANRIQNQTVKETAAQSVNASIDTRSGDLVASGMSKDNAAVQAAQEEYNKQQIRLTTARKQYADTVKAFNAATGEEKKRLLQDGNADALVLKQAKENARVASAALAQATKDRAGRAAALKNALNEPASDADKKAGKAAQKAAEDNYKLLLSAQDEYVKEYTKLETEFGKDRLEALKKDQNAYIAEKARLDKQVVDAEQAHILKLLQLASSNKTVINKATGRREVVANQSIQLPADIQKQFDDRKNAIDAEADRQIRINKIRQEYELLELGKQSNAQEIALYDKKWEGILASEKVGSDKYIALVKKRDSERSALIYDQVIRDQKAIESIALSRIDARKKDPTETGQQFNKRNQLDALATNQFSAESQIEALQLQSNPANNPEIARLEAYVKAIKDKRKEIELLTPANRDIFDLLGISKSFKDETERQVFLDAAGIIKNAIQETTQLIIDQSQQKIDALDAQIQAKNEQIGIEEERDREGYANNLALRKAELEDLKHQKSEEEAVKRRALAVQQTIDLATVVSNNAVTASNLISAAAKAFDKSITSTFNPVLGVILAIGAIATIFATIAAVTAKAKAISKLRSGGKLDGAKHERGGIRGTGTFDDIEVEGGEHVTNAKSSERFDKTLEAINKGNPHEALKALMKEGGIGLPAIIIQQMKEPGFGTSKGGQDMSRLVDTLNEHGELLKVLVKHTRPGKQYVTKSKEGYIEFDGNKRIDHNP